MIQKIFIDTNVLLDLILDREPFARQAEDVFNLRDEYGLEFYISALSVANLAYVLERLKTKPHTSISKLLPWVKIVSLTSDVIQETLVSRFDDFEDGLQYASAASAKVDIIVTRNKKDFKHSILPVHSPAEFLKLFTH